MQNFQKTESSKPIAWLHQIADIPGGGVIEYEGDGVPAGTPVSIVNGRFKKYRFAVVETLAADDATSIRIHKGHELKVGDVIKPRGGAGVSKAIATLVTTEDDYDTITVAVTLGVQLEVGDMLVIADKVGSSAVDKYEPPVGLTGEDVIEVEDGNVGVSVWVIGVLKKEYQHPLFEYLRGDIPGIITV